MNTCTPSIIFSIRNNDTLGLSEFCHDRLHFPSCLCFKIKSSIVQIKKKHFLKANHLNVLNLKINYILLFNVLVFSTTIENTDLVIEGE